MHLPHEVLSEILSWVDVDSLLRFRTVCKEWCSLIEDPTFIGSHIMKIRGQWFFETLIDNGPATYNKYEYLDSYIGLLLECTDDPISLRLTYPSTGKILELPDPGKSVPREMRMCHINSLDVLKLVVPCRYYRSDVRKSVRAFKVLTIGGVDVTWREIDIPFGTRGYDCSMETVMIGEVCFMLWLACICPKEVICLEMENEEISRIKLPDGIRLGRHFAPLAWGESLALGSVRKFVEEGEDEGVHIWVLEDRKENRWAEKEIIVPLKFVGCRAKRKMDLWASSENGLLVNCYPNEVLMLDVASGMIKWRYNAPHGICFTGLRNLRRFASPKRPHFWNFEWSPPSRPDYYGDIADNFENVPVAAAEEEEQAAAEEEEEV